MIAIFGASVTQQKRGFAKKLKRRLDRRVEIFGFGGVHLDDGAICFIDRVLVKRPSICFVDWFTTGYNHIGEKTILCLDAIIYRFSGIRCKLIFLFLPFQDDSEKSSFYAFCKQHLVNRGVSYIDVSEMTLGIGLNTLLRDRVHTTEAGSCLYADIISREFAKIKEVIRLPAAFYENKYVKVRELSVARTFYGQVKLHGHCEIVGFLLTVGPYSGCISIQSEFETRKINTRDRWCYYPRKHFSIDANVAGSVVIKVLPFDDKTITTAYNGLVIKTRRPRLVIHSIFYVGDALAVDNLSDGGKIWESLIVAEKCLGRFKQYWGQILRKRRRT